MAVYTGSFFVWHFYTVAPFGRCRAQQSPSANVSNSHLNSMSLVHGSRSVGLTRVDDRNNWCAAKSRELPFSEPINFFHSILIPAGQSRPLQHSGGCIHWKGPMSLDQKVENLILE